MGGNGCFGELHVHRGTGDLNYVSDIFWHNDRFSTFGQLLTAVSQLSVVKLGLNSIPVFVHRGSNCSQRITDD